MVPWKISISWPFLRPYRICNQTAYARRLSTMPTPRHSIPCCAGLIAIHAVYTTRLTKSATHFSYTFPGQAPICHLYAVAAVLCFFLPFMYYLRSHAISQYSTTDAAVWIQNMGHPKWHDISLLEYPLGDLILINVIVGAPLDLALLFAPPSHLTWTCFDTFCDLAENPDLI
jgi:hypothetical protein